MDDVKEGLIYARWIGIRLTVDGREHWSAEYRDDQTALDALAAELVDLENASNRSAVAEAAAEIAEVLDRLRKREPASVELPDEEVPSIWQVPRDPVELEVAWSAIRRYPNLDFHEVRRFVRRDIANPALPVVYGTGRVHGTLPPVEPVEVRGDFVYQAPVLELVDDHPTFRFELYAAQEDAIAAHERAAAWLRGGGLRRLAGPEREDEIRTLRFEEAFARARTRCRRLPDRVLGEALTAWVERVAENHPPKTGLIELAALDELFQKVELGECMTV